jgi:alpha-ketoglutarate-dependent 2,4-dichlorophenoxyacetate dioxygenase
MFFLWLLHQNLYVASHIHHFEGLPKDESDKLVKELILHATQPKYLVNINWVNNGDLVIWDNTCVMHRAMGGAFEGVYERDMRRATVHDSSSTAYGLNGHGSTWRVGLP